MGQNKSKILVAWESGDPSVTAVSGLGYTCLFQGDKPKYGTLFTGDGDEKSEHFYVCNFKANLIDLQLLDLPEKLLEAISSKIHRETKRNSGVDPAAYAAALERIAFYEAQAAAANAKTETVATTAAVKTEKPAASSKPAAGKNPSKRFVIS